MRVLYQNLRNDWSHSFRHKICGNYALFPSLSRFLPSYDLQFLSFTHPHIFTILYITLGKAQPPPTLLTRCYSLMSSSSLSLISLLLSFLFLSLSSLSPSLSFSLSHFLPLLSLSLSLSLFRSFCESWSFLSFNCYAMCGHFWCVCVFFYNLVLCSLVASFLPFSLFYLLLLFLLYLSAFALFFSLSLFSPYPFLYLLICSCFWLCL